MRHKLSLLNYRRIREDLSVLNKVVYVPYLSAGQYTFMTSFTGMPHGITRMSLPHSADKIYCEAILQGGNMLFIRGRIHEFSPA